MQELRLHNMPRKNAKAKTEEVVPEVIEVTTVEVAKEVQSVPFKIVVINDKQYKEFRREDGTTFVELV